MDGATEVGAHADSSAKVQSAGRPRATLPASPDGGAGNFMP
jgi:hypothetical protein